LHLPQAFAAEDLVPLSDVLESELTDQWSRYGLPLLSWQAAGGDANVLWESWSRGAEEVLLRRRRRHGQPEDSKIRGRGTPFKDKIISAQLRRRQL
jgi:hypothetical protein